MKQHHLKWFLLLIGLAVLILTGCPAGQTSSTETEPAVTTSTSLVPTEKPVIYLYPEKMIDVQVGLDYLGLLTCTYPAYNGGWQVTAYPDGTLVNKADGRQFAYLFWEGLTGEPFDLQKGFVVRGADTAVFLEEKLAFLGLNADERNDFLVYWLPDMQDNAYNLITFQGDAYTQLARLTITPQPDSLIRVFMAWKPLQEPVEIAEPELVPGVRKGFTAVEWGGSCIK